MNTQMIYLQLWKTLHMQLLIMISLSFWIIEPKQKKALKEKKKSLERDSDLKANETLISKPN